MADKPSTASQSPGVHYEPGEKHSSANSAGRVDQLDEFRQILLYDFEVGKDRIKPEHDQFLKSLVALFRLNSVRPCASVALIEGFTDAVDTEKVNAGLRMSRANAVAQTLMRHGVPTANIGVVRGATGESLSGNKTLQDRAYSRAVRLDLCDDFSGPPHAPLCTGQWLQGPPAMPCPPLSFRAARAKRLPGPTGVGKPAPGADDCVKHVSWELADACTFADAPTTMTGLSKARQAVLNWLRAFQDELVQAEETWSIDRRAIAGAIAWEALENVSGSTRNKITRRSAGPGKVHLWEFAKTPISKEVLQAGYLDFVGIKEGKLAETLATPGGAITVIGAIMRAQADAVSAFAQYKEADTYWNPPVLAAWFHAKNLNALVWEYGHNKKKPATLEPGEIPMGVWVKANMDFLEEAVGKLPEGMRPSPVPAIPGTVSAKDQLKRQEKVLQELIDKSQRGPYLP